MNLVGFFPLGFLLGVLLGARRRAVLVVVLTGFTISLAIELAQTLTITRVSSVFDLGLNTGGALAGAWLAQRMRN
jgi:glycopeptide antibiotics resistance protein